MSRTARRAVPALGLALAAAVAATGAASGHGNGDGSGGRVIRFTTQQAHQTLLDNGAPGFSVDDVVIYSNDLYQEGRKIGEDGGTCTVVRFPPGGTATMHCAGTNTLPGGQITVAGFASPGEPFELAITGGTGRYRTARGQVVGRNTGPTEMEIALVLR